jgi:hypothetical protein
MPPRSQNCRIDNPLAAASTTAARHCARRRSFAGFRRILYKKHVPGNQVERIHVIADQPSKRLVRSDLLASLTPAASVPRQTPAAEGPDR